MTKEELEWFSYEDPPNLLISFNRSGLKRKDRLFAVACCHRISPLITDERCQHAVVVAERFADAHATKRELQAAKKKATAAWMESNGEHAARACEQVCSENVDAYDLSINAANAAIRSLQRRVAVQLEELQELYRAEQKEQSRLLRDVFGNPFRKPPKMKKGWLTETVVALAASIYAERAFDRMPILADALEDAGCDHADILTHCRGDGPHVRGCWVVDLILGKS